MIWMHEAMFWFLMAVADPLPSGFRCRCREARQLRGTFSSCQAVNHVESFIVAKVAKRQSAKICQAAIRGSMYRECKGFLL